MAVAANVAERAVLTCLSLRPSCAAEIASAGVDASSFGHPEHRTLFRAMLEIIEAEGRVDLPSLLDLLRRAGASLADDPERVGAMIDAPHVWSDLASRHAANVIDYAERRRVWAVHLSHADDALDLTRPISKTKSLGIEALGGDR